MTQALTDKNHVLVLRGNVKIYINEQEKDGIVAVISKGQEMFEVQGKLIMRHAILYLISAEEQDTAEKIKRGYWKCHAGKLHSPEYTDCSC